MTSEESRAVYGQRSGGSRLFSVAVVGTDELGSSLAESLERRLQGSAAAGGPWEVGTRVAEQAAVLVVVGGASGAVPLIRRWADSSRGGSAALPAEPRRKVLLVAAVGGVRLADLRAITGSGPGLCRAVFVAPAGSGEDLVLACLEEDMPAPERDLCCDLLRGMGTLEAVTEDVLDAAAGVVSAGPGLLGSALIGMEQGAVDAGLLATTTRPVLRQTLLATALLLAEETGSPAELKDRVASPGGTTIAAIAVLEERAVRGALIRAVEEAAGRRGK